MPIFQTERPAGRILVTRPQPQADDWVARLAALGIEARALPLLGIADAEDAAPVHAAWARLAELALVMFVSPSAVQRFFEARPAQLAAAWPASVRAGSTGPGTEAALRRAGVPAAAIVTPPAAGRRFDSEALWHRLLPLRDWRDAQVLIVRGEDGRDWLAETLRRQGARVQFVAAYRRTAPQLDAAARGALADALAAPDAHWWLFSSSEAVRHLPALAPLADWSPARALATHPRIVQAAREIGFGRVEAVEVSPEAVAAFVTRSIQSPRP